MTLSFGDGWDEPVQFDDWPLQGTPHFATSRAYDIFLRELRRYTLEEVGGRSFLIAGHRGAGKTALVVQAVEALRNERIQQSVSADLNSVSRRGRLQRPLLVKLAAHSLIAAPPKLRKPEADKPGEGKDGKPAPAPSPTPATSPAPAPAPAAPEDPPDPVAGALVHLSIALYRALAQEVAQGFAFHAASTPGSGRADLREMAAQLLLDLDDAPEPALLRRKWEQLGRLADGVLWPRSAAATLDAARIEDQGLREIIAVATAAQAFQVVSGNVTYKTTSSDAATRDDETKASLDIKDLVARLGAVFAGTAAGSVAVAASQGAPLALGLGLLVWLGSSVALSRTISHKLHRVRTRDYTFLRDRSVQTLDRELPQVIERVRDAGLAPVFVVDELDKLDNVDATITALIGRLKHIVSDYGFFCFLTGRGYYDGIDRLTAKEPYPKEHTYFSDRLLIAARPTDLFRYVTQLVVSDGAADENLPLATFALMAIHRSKLNFTDLVRELNRHARSDRALTLTTQELRERADLRLEAAIQLAGDEALRDPVIANRFAEDEGFAQLAVDALHYLPRLWEEDFNQEVDCSDTTLKDVLIARMAGKCKADPPPPDPVAPAAGASFTISASDWLLLKRLVNRQLGYLSDFASLVQALRDRPRPDPWRLDEIVPVELGQSLIRADDAPARRYRFLLDTTATPIAQKAAATPAKAPPGDVPKLFEAFDALLAFVGLTLDDLVAAGYMPATLTSEAVAEARKLLDGPDRSPELTDAAMRTGALLRHALVTRGNQLAALLGTLERYRVYADESKRTPAQMAAAIARYYPATESGGDTAGKGLAGLPTGAVAAGLVGLTMATVMGLTGFRELLDKDRVARPRPAALVPSRSGRVSQERRWRERLLAWIEQGIAKGGDVENWDIITAVQGVPPGSLFRSDLNSMTPRDWSAVVVASLPRKRGLLSLPDWALFAGLYALGFDGRSLSAVATVFNRRLPKTQAIDTTLVARIAAKAKTSAPGGLILVEPDGSTAALDHDYGDQPVITMALADFNDYKQGIGWLAEAGVIAGLIDESE